jgi:hypothetical protein
MTNKETLVVTDEDPVDVVRAVVGEFDDQFDIEASADALHDHLIAALEDAGMMSPRMVRGRIYVDIPVRCGIPGCGPGCTYVADMIADIRDIVRDVHNDGNYLVARTPTPPQGV